MAGQKFDPRNMELLDSWERKKILPVERIIEAFDLPEEVNIADIGCGTGYLTLPVVQKVDRNSNIYAVDIEPKMLSMLKKRAKGLDNIKIIKSTETYIPIKEATIDISYLIAVLHELDSPSDILREIIRISKHNHWVIVVDWNEREGGMGPPMKIRVPRDKAIGLFKNHGYELVKEFSPSEYFYGLVFKR